MRDIPIPNSAGVNVATSSALDGVEEIVARDRERAEWIARYAVESVNGAPDFAARLQRGIVGAGLAAASWDWDSIEDARALYEFYCELDCLRSSDPSGQGREVLSRALVNYFDRQGVGKATQLFDGLCWGVSVLEDALLAVPRALGFFPLARLVLRDGLDALMALRDGVADCYSFIVNESYSDAHEALCWSESLRLGGNRNYVLPPVPETSRRAIIGALRVGLTWRAICDFDINIDSMTLQRRVMANRISQSIGKLGDSAPNADSESFRIFYKDVLDALQLGDPAVEDYVEHVAIKLIYNCLDADKFAVNGLYSWVSPLVQLVWCNRNCPEGGAPFGAQNC